MAFGNVGDVAKFYFFAAPSGGGLFLLELIISKSSGVASGSLKAAGAAQTFAHDFSALARSLLSS